MRCRYRAGAIARRGATPHPVTATMSPSTRVRAARRSRRRGRRRRGGGQGRRSTGAALQGRGGPHGPGSPTPGFGTPHQPFRCAPTPSRRPSNRPCFAAACAAHTYLLHNSCPAPMSSRPGRIRVPTPFRVSRPQNGPVRHEIGHKHRPCAHQLRNSGLAVSRTVQQRTGLAIRNVIRQLRPLRSATIAINGAEQTFPPAIPAKQQAILDAINGPKSRALSK